MHNVFKGLVVSGIGIIIWFLFSVIQGVEVGFEGSRDPVFEAFMVIGFTLMILGPIIYIVILPTVSWWMRRRVTGG